MSNELVAIHPAHQLKRTLLPMLVRDPIQYQDSLVKYRAAFFELRSSSSFFHKCRTVTLCAHLFPLFVKHRSEMCTRVEKSAVNVGHAVSLSSNNELY